MQIALKMPEPWQRPHSVSLAGLKSPLPRQRRQVCVPNAPVPLQVKQGLAERTTRPEPLQRLHAPENVPVPSHLRQENTRLPEPSQPKHVP